MHSSFSLLPASSGFMLGVLFDLEDADDMFLQSIGLSLNYGFETQ
jgi:hypothetical protein